MKTKQRFRTVLSMITTGLLACTGVAFASSDDYAEDFETYTVGMVITNVTGWTAAETNSVIVSTNYTASYQGGTYPIVYDHTVNTKALDIGNGVTNTLTAGAINQTNWVDMAVLPRLYGENDVPAVPPLGSVAAVYFNSSSNLVVMHAVSNDYNNLQWLEIPDVSVSDDEWIRLTIAANMKDGSAFSGDATRFFQVYINGSVVTNEAAFQTPSIAGSSGGSWFASGAPISRSAPITNVMVKGTGFLDDLVVTNALTLTAPSQWTITASAGTNGTITPSGSIQVTEGNSQAFTITPDSGYLVDDVVVVENGTTNSLGSVTGYTFNNVAADGSITASFVAETVWTITASAGANGSINPAGSVQVVEGNSQAFTVTADAGYLIDDVVVVENGTTNSLGSVTGYTFNNVIADGSITASFAAEPPATTTNGTPTTWYDQFGLTPTGTETYDDMDMLDSDSDGVLNWKEYIAGTIPTNAASVFKILGATADGSGNVQLDWYGGTNGPVAPYIVEAATSLDGTPIGWADMTNGAARAEGTNTWSGTGMGGMQFFRVLATPDP